ncbi:DUF1573 domain-containing protein [Paenibacillus chitinolyticus]|uniref:DUF1573 domain-containing protein n=1 Tax=Paenibacillus chitinolyticus TaxID=79263 RepID=A0A410X4J2_9BACL|nr:hypothetical protein [Paenibacillus chitinolyticus]MCY9590670.1 DUF1573 domain-containing protein [Paenibacillus chitinolyticus]MCY9599444.1 DUF1573 domain-containing protein [Paenibacillus chitinolyticus]QAV21532.1 DUF1573 domain-containing protein [Paenibacillus chitinolyticus]GKS14405.1 hypothetical protein YDYSY3_54050 [Paenibacillus chitinolyticus]
MSALSLKDFQEQVGELLLRHRSLLDVLSKFQQSNAGVNRSVIKSITECGCVEVNAKKQEYSPEMTLDQAKIELQTHLEGQLCEHCMEAISTEIGKHLFYLSALSNLLDVNLEKVLEDESKKCSTLGFFNMS